MEGNVKPERHLTIKVDAPGLDEVLEKANRLVELLREASAIIDSLTVKGELEI